MSIRKEKIDITVGKRQISGTLLSPAVSMEGVLFIHGWAGDQAQYAVRASAIAALGCVCMTFDLYGHAKTGKFLETTTREDNLADVAAAYDLLASNPYVDKDNIGVVGSSYGGYLGAILTSMRPVCWLALRAPALYKDDDWSLPKYKLNREEISAYRKLSLEATANRALRACAAFKGDVLLVESEFDDIVPSSVTANYRTAFDSANSLTFRVLKGADHGLSDTKSQDAYTALLSKWTEEMLLDARKARSATEPAELPKEKRRESKLRQVK